MTNLELKQKIEAIKSLSRLIEEAQSEVEAYKDEIKAYMGDAEEIVLDAFKVTFKAVTSTRLDTASLKKALPEIAERFSKTSTVRRFCIM